MGLLEDIREDAKMIVSGGDGDGFDLPAIIDNQVDPVIETSVIFFRRTDSLEYEDGSKKNSPFSRCIINMDVLNLTEKYISLKGWTITVDGDNYTIDECFPNRTLGIIPCNLKDNG
jgi:hypothetical protein